MKDNPSTLVESSRRKFTKSIVGALAFTPLLSAVGTAQRKKPRRPPAKPSIIMPSVPPEGLHAVGPMTSPQREFISHEPPIIVGDGSVFMEVPGSELNPINHEGPYKYIKPNTTDILQVTIIRYNDLTGVVYNPVVFPYRGLELRLWIVRGNQRPTGSPQIVIRDRRFRTDCAAGADCSIIVEVDKKLAHQQTDNPDRPHKYTHPGFGAGSFFHIGKLEVEPKGFLPWPLVTDKGDKLRLLFTYDHPPIAKGDLRR